VGDPASARLRPLGWGLTAALAGTLAANFFYLTMTFYYFYVLAVFVLAVPLVFGQRLPSPLLSNGPEREPQGQLRPVEQA
jgi:hypothetical protein